MNHKTTTKNQNQIQKMKNNVVIQKKNDEPLDPRKMDEVLELLTKGLYNSRTKNWTKLTLFQTQKYLTEKWKTTFINSQKVVMIYVKAAYEILEEQGKENITRSVDKIDLLIDELDSQILETWNRALEVNDLPAAQKSIELRMSLLGIRDFQKAKYKFLRTVAGGTRNPGGGSGNIEEQEQPPPAGLFNLPESVVIDSTPQSKLSNPTAGAIEEDSMKLGDPESFPSPSNLVVKVKEEIK